MALPSGQATFSDFCRPGALPLSAIVVVYNELEKLPSCLRSVSFCDEVILCDISCSNASRSIARELATKIIAAEKVPYKEIILPSLVAEARHDWLLLLDPDEVVDVRLVPLIRTALSAVTPEVCGVRLPWRFYFKGEALRSTPWGGLKYKSFIVNRKRVEFRPLVHHELQQHAGTEWFTIEETSGAVVHHYWIDSYAQFFEKHLRYIQAEGEARYKKGKRFEIRKLVSYAISLSASQLRPTAWLKDGRRGIVLCCLYIWYEVLSALSLRKYQRSRQ